VLDTDVLELDRRELPLTIRIRGRRVRDYVLRRTVSGGVVLNIKIAENGKKIVDKIRIIE